MDTPRRPARLAWLAGLLSAVACAPLPPAPEPPPEEPLAAHDEAALASVAALPWETLAMSREGRPIRQATFGSGPRRVLWVGGIHGDEAEGAHATNALPAAFLAAADAAERVTLVVIEDLNPDGRARHRRGNARGVDLNRNFPAASFHAGRTGGPEPLSEPESLALFELVVGWRPDLVLVSHSWRAARFINFDGPARAEAERFAERSGFELRESTALAPTPGSFGSWAEERGLPVLTLEYRRGTEPEEAWNETREAVLGAVLGD